MRWRKSDADAIAAYMADLPKILRLGQRRRRWPRWLYRSDHVENTARILNAGRVLSRARAERAGLIIQDSGSADHIAQLTDQQRDYVRLYFRPRAPTQYHNEGIRPKSQIRFGAHMPVPVYLLFSVKLLEYVGVEFTRGRLLVGTETGGSSDFLSSIAFRDVYHDGPVGKRREIINARHAEVIVRGELGLHRLKHIVCRSGAERATLLWLLSEETRAYWGPRVIVDEGKGRLFHKLGTFLQDVQLTRDTLRFQFYENTHPEYRGPFVIRVVVRTDAGEFASEVPDYFVGGRPAVFRLTPPRERYVVRVTMNSDLAYAGTFDGEELTDAVLP